MSEYFICDKCCEPKDSNAICISGRKLLCFECFDEQEKAIQPHLKEGNQ